MNTYQGIVITDGNTTYAVFTYQCGLMEWSRGATIGFNAAGQIYENHPFSGSENVHEIACVNSPDLEWSNLVYKLTNESLGPLPDPPTVEPRMFVVQEIVSSQ